MWSITGGIIFLRLNQNKPKAYMTLLTQCENTKKGTVSYNNDGKVSYCTIPYKGPNDTCGYSVYSRCTK